MYRRRCWWTQLPSTKWSQNHVVGRRTSIPSRPQSERRAVSCEQRCSHTGTRTRVCWVEAGYPHRLDYMGKLTSWHNNTSNTRYQAGELKFITVLIAQCCWWMHDTNKSWMLESTISMHNPYECTIRTNHGCLNPPYSFSDHIRIGISYTYRRYFGRKHDESCHMASVYDSVLIMRNHHTHIALGLSIAEVAC